MQLIGTFKDWSAYSASEGAGAVCFAMSKPTDVDAVARRLHAGLSLSDASPGRERQPTSSTSSPASTSPPTSRRRSTVGGKSFDLFTQKDAAWLLDADPERQPRRRHAGRHRRVVIQGTTDKGILVTETFSLSRRHRRQQGDRQRLLGAAFCVRLLCARPRTMLQRAASSAGPTR